MPHFGARFEDLASDTTDESYISVVGIKMADTVGHRLRLRSIVISGYPDGASPVDKQINLRLARSDNTSDGTATAQNVNTIAKKDPDSVASNVAALKTNYTAEPTTIDTDKLPLGTLNTRGTLVKEWTDPDEMPRITRDQTLLLQVEKNDGAASAILINADIEWEEY